MEPFKYTIYDILTSILLMAQSSILRRIVLPGKLSILSLKTYNLF